MFYSAQEKTDRVGESRKTESQDSRDEKQGLHMITMCFSIGIEAEGAADTASRG